MRNVPTMISRTPLIKSRCRFEKRRWVNESDIERKVTQMSEALSAVASVYVGLSADILHPGHINILEHARGLGEVTVGLLTDEAIARKKRLPALTYEQRERIVKNLVGVTRVVPQEDWDYSMNLLKYKPRFMVHGDDWLTGPETGIREKCLRALDSYGGNLVEIPYTHGLSSGALHEAAMSIGTTPDIRRRTLRRLLEAKPLVRVLEAHSPLSAIIAQSASIVTEEETKTFDCFWSSSLTDSTHAGKPDIEVLDLSDRLNSVNRIFEVTTLPLIFDGDTGGQPEHFALAVRSLERLGVSAVIIEDKKGLKKNSLLGNDVLQVQEDPYRFANKIQTGMGARVTNDFMIFARIESLILEAGMEDALNRARIYVEAGASGVMIHSRDASPKSVFEFAEKFRRDFDNTPLISVPTAYNGVTELELQNAGFQIVIYANHLLRASYPAMVRAADKILAHGRSLELDGEIASLPEILNLIPGTR